ncbi:MAG: NUDIX domain-containing protein [Clostridia bacterium]|nr:NUDIX domain-containing protein [Clostridia bacterium]
MEIIDICDEHGNPTGETVERRIAHRDGIPHRTAHVWIVRRRDGVWEVLLQKRSMEKDSYPGLFDTSSAGHIPAGSDPVTSALRELEEELGIRADPDQLTPAGSFRIRYEDSFHGKPFRDNEFTFVYVYRDPVDADSLILQESEVDAAEWFGLGEVREEIRRSRARFCMASEGLDLLRAFLGEDEPDDNE